MSTDDVREKIIPESLVNAAREIAAICRKYNMRMCSATLHPSWEDQFHDDLQFIWTQGRHGAGRDNVCLTYKRKINVSIAENGERS